MSLLISKKQKKYHHIKNKLATEIILNVSDKRIQVTASQLHSDKECISTITENKNQGEIVPTNVENILFPHN